MSGLQEGDKERQKSKKETGVSPGDVVVQRPWLFVFGGELGQPVLRFGR